VRAARAPKNTNRRLTPPPTGPPPTPHPNPTEPRWVQNLEQEFFAQGDVERANAMAISPLFDRNHAGITRSQVGGSGGGASGLRSGRSARPLKFI
jgi:hypothetical protein